MSEVQQLNDQLEYSKHLVKMRDTVVRLRKNKDFKYLIDEVFLEKECAAYARASADYSLDEDSRKSSLAMAQAAGHLETFLNKYMVMGAQAEATIPHVEQAILEAMQEGEDDE